MPIYPIRIGVATGPAQRKRREVSRAAGREVAPVEVVTMMCARNRSEVLYFSSVDVDGFPMLDSEVAAYCPRQGKKVPLNEHGQCEYYELMEQAELLGIVAVRCRFDSRKR